MNTLSRHVNTISLMKVVPEGPIPVIPTQDDIQGVSRVQALAFAEKNRCYWFQKSLEPCQPKNLILIGVGRWQMELLRTYRLIIQCSKVTEQIHIHLCDWRRMNCPTNHSMNMLRNAWFPMVWILLKLFARALFQTGDFVQLHNCLHGYGLRNSHQTNS